MTDTMSPEERASAIIPMHYRVETARTTMLPNMDMVLSSRCAGALRDAIAAAIRQAEAEAYERAAKVAEEEAEAGRADIRAGDVPKVLAGVKVQTAINIERAIRSLTTSTEATDNV